MNLFALIAFATAFITLLGLTWRLTRNLRFLRRADALPTAYSTPRISVLVPARDEARTIEACVTSLAQQAYPNFEIIALNDQSSDATGNILEALAAQYPAVRVLHGHEALPAGWNGKSFACQRLAEQATGEWLLFTDADTQHSATSLFQGITQAQALGLDLLSFFPHQLTQTWSEKLVVSFILDFLPLLAFDLQGLWQGTSASVAANGQYLLIRAEAYRAMGGHQAVRSALVDDFALARRAHSEGYRVALLDGRRSVHCRMYHHAGEVWQGFTKNILLALETSRQERQPWWWGAALAWGYACLFVLPFGFVLLPAFRLPALGILAGLFGLRAVAQRYFRRPWTEVLSTPLAAWSVMAFGSSAFLRRRARQPVRWKGRNYTASV